MKALPLAFAVLVLASAASAADTGTNGVPRRGTVGTAMGQGSTGTTTTTAAPGAEATMSELLSRGYDIKAAVPNGGKFIVFMQKDQSAYACEFQSLTGARCGSIN